jgi:hypothetical protein
MQLGSMFINNCNNALHVSDAICVHLQEHLKTVVTASGVRHAVRYKANISSQKTEANQNIKQPPQHRRKTTNLYPKKYKQQTQEGRCNDN